MNNNYLIPANSKKSQLILGFMNYVDLFIFLIGLFVTLVLLIFIKNPPFGTMVLIVLPLLSASFLILPVPHYHNMLQLIINVITFFNSRRKYFWKGWCVCDDSEIK